MFIVRVILLVTLMAYASFSQEPQQVTLDKETIDALLQVLSPACKFELEGAVEQQQSDISDECKQEIQRSLQSFGQFPHHNDYDRQFEDPPHRSNESKKSAPSGGIHPGIAIAVFVVIMATVFCGAVYYINYNLEKSGITKKSVKKLSKKKEEKQRLKNQQQGMIR